MQKIPTALKKLYEAAKKARENAYSPYSGYKVGAAILDISQSQKGKIFTGCNVENSSYGATVCAERTAIQSAVAAQGSLTIAEIMVVTDATPPWPPCGLCRQVIAEFARDKEILIHAANLKGEIITTSYDSLMPNAFLPSHLSKKRSRK